MFCIVSILLYSGVRTNPCCSVEIILLLQVLVYMQLTTSEDLGTGAKVEHGSVECYYQAERGASVESAADVRSFAEGIQ